MTERTRLDVAKTHKMLVGGKFIRSESGKVVEAPAPDGPERVCAASRKDLRDAVVAAQKAASGWSSRDAYNRGQVLYRLAEMLEGRTEELQRLVESALSRAHDTEAEVTLAIDTVVHFAGWADKASQVLGSVNQVSGPYFNVSMVEPVGVIAVVLDPAAPLVSFASMVSSALCVGNSVICIWPTESGCLASSVCEAIATSDMPGGSLNVLTGAADELSGELASHRGIDGILAVASTGAIQKSLELGAAENLKRVHVIATPDWMNPDVRTGVKWLSRVTEVKTAWHPAGV